MDFFPHEWPEIQIFHEGIKNLDQTWTYAVHIWNELILKAQPKFIAIYFGWDEIAHRIPTEKDFFGTEPPSCQDEIRWWSKRENHRFPLGYVSPNWASNSESTLINPKWRRGRGCERIEQIKPRPTQGRLPRGRWLPAFEVQTVWLILGPGFPWTEPCVALSNSSRGYEGRGK